MAKILCAPDLHYGYDNHSVPGPDGIPSRVAEWRIAAADMVNLARTQRVDVALMPGDAFTSGKHSPQAIIEVYNLYRQVEETGGRVIGTFGNHDFAGTGKRGPVDVLAELGSPWWGITMPQFLSVPMRDPNEPALQVAVLPWTKATALLQESDGAGDLNARASTALTSIVHGLAAQVDPTRPAVLLGHWPVSGCMLSSGQTLVGGEPAIALGDLQAGPWSAVVMGHIHKRQEFPGRPLVVHTGALTRRDFGEERDDCGCYILDTDTGEATWHELPARRFFTWDLDDRLIYEATTAIPDGVHFGPDEAQGAICRVRYRVTEEQHRRIDQRIFLRALEEAGAHVVAGVFPEIIRAERTRAEGLTEDTDPAAALDKWLDLRGDLSLDLKAEVRQAMQELLREVS